MCPCLMCLISDNTIKGLLFYWRWLRVGRGGIQSQNFFKLRNRNRPTFLRTGLFIVCKPKTVSYER